MVPTASSPPTAGSTTLVPPGSSRTCSSATSTRCRRTASRWATANITIERHPADKAATDTELALVCAAAMHPQRLVLVAGRGDRLDHTIAALGALGAESLAGIPAIEGWWGSDHVLVGRPTRPVHVARAAGTTFSLLALHGPCRGVTITGSRWPLVDADLGSVVGLGVSNEVLEPPCRIELAAGVVTVIIPGAQP